MGLVQAMRTEKDIVEAHGLINFQNYKLPARNSMGPSQSRETVGFVVLLQTCKIKFYCFIRGQQHTESLAG
jgi:hypothetical protein